MVNWHRFTPADFEYDFERDELAAHRVSFEEAVECFFSDFEIRRNKSYRDRYQLLGRTDGGRRLKIIFQLKPATLFRSLQDGRYEDEEKRHSHLLNQKLTRSLLLRQMMTLPGESLSGSAEPKPRPSRYH